MRMAILKQRVFAALFCAMSTHMAAASVQAVTDPATGLQSWQLQAHDFSLQLVQRLPDQTRAFFQARGFSKQVADKIATHCVLQAIGKNTSHAPNGSSIEYNLADWQVRVNGKLQHIKLKSDWEREWVQDDRVSKASRIAFRWATFPSQQNFEPDGDFNWGMISFDLPPGTAFDLQLVWKQNKQLRQQWINKILCPSDQS
jgi:hypothetical protein